MGSCILITDLEIIKPIFMRSLIMVTKSWSCPLVFKHLSKQIDLLIYHDYRVKMWPIELSKSFPTIWPDDVVLDPTRPIYKRTSIRYISSLQDNRAKKCKTRILTPKGSQLKAAQKSSRQAFWLIFKIFVLKVCHAVSLN